MDYLKDILESGPPRERPLTQQDKSHHIAHRNWKPGGTDFRWNVYKVNNLVLSMHVVPARDVHFTLILCYVAKIIITL